MSGRVGLRAFQQYCRTQFRTQGPLSRSNVGKRFQTTATADAAATPPPQQSFLQRIWTSEVGVKTVHFWAPVMKWGVVLAGATDFLRPADKLSLNTNAALVATGTIWTRWCFVIRPKNMLLAGVNFCLACVGIVQCSRIFAYRRSIEGSTEGALKSIVQEEKDDGKKLKAEAKAAAS